MKIEKIEYGSFKEVNPLYPEFSPDKKKVRAIISLDPALKVWKENIPNVMMSAYDLIQDCSEQICSSFIGFHTGENLKNVEQIPFIIEHLMLGIIKDVGRNEHCRGLTCSSKENTNLYNIFIECDDPRLGEFALATAKNLIEDILIHGDRSPLWDYLFDSARYLYPAVRYDRSIKEIMKKFGWSNEQAELVVKTLSKLSFFYYETGEA